MVVAIAMIVFLVSLIFIKNSARVSYFDAWNNNEDYQTITSNIAKTAFNLEMTNLYHGMSMSQTAYNSLLSAPNLTVSMNTFANYYDREDVASTWPTLTFLSDKTIMPGSEANNLVIDKYLQRPLSNLTSYAYADYSFPINYASLSAPLTQIQK